MNAILMLLLIVGVEGLLMALMAYLALYIKGPRSERWADDVFRLTTRRR